MLPYSLLPVIPALLLSFYTFEGGFGKVGFFKPPPIPLPIPPPIPLPIAVVRFWTIIDFEAAGCCAGGFSSKVLTLI